MTDRAEHKRLIRWNNLFLLDMTDRQTSRHQISIETQHIMKLNIDLTSPSKKVSGRDLQKMNDRWKASRLQNLDSLKNVLDFFLHFHL